MPQFIFAQFIHKHKKSLRLFVAKNHFTRRRKLSLTYLVGHLLFLAGDARRFGSQIVSQRFFAELKKFRSSKIKGLSKSSISEARAKLPWQAIKLLLKKAAIEHSGWKGHTVRAIDGSQLTLPHSKAILSEFSLPTSVNNNAGFYPRSRLLTAVNVHTLQPTHAKIDSIHMGERTQCKDLIKEFEVGDVLLLDRGFESNDLWSEIDRQKQFFVSRVQVKLKSNGFAKILISKKSKDLVILHRGLKLRIILDKHKDGLLFIIVTNLLDQKKYTRNQILELYKLRWAIETQFKRLKQNLNIQNFHSRSTNGIKQEIFAGLLMLSLLSGMTFYAGKSLSPSYQINFTAAAAILWPNLHLFIKGLRKRSHNRQRIRALLRNIARFFQKIRPDRHFPRVSKQSENKWIKARRTNNHIGKDSWKNRKRPPNRTPLPAQVTMAHHCSCSRDCYYEK